MYIKTWFFKITAGNIIERLAHALSRVVKAVGLAGCLMVASQAMAAGAHSSEHIGKTHAAVVDLRIVIPRIMRVLENSYPALLPVASDQTFRVSALQRLVLVSTLPRGFCMDLHLTLRQVTDWQLKLSGSAGTRIESSSGGYRLCTARAGRHEIALSHDFQLPDTMWNTSSPPLDWPVQVSLTAP